MPSDEAERLRLDPRHPATRLDQGTAPDPPDRANCVFVALIRPHKEAAALGAVAGQIPEESLLLSPRRANVEIGAGPCASSRYRARRLKARYAGFGFRLCLRSPAESQNVQPPVFFRGSRKSNQKSDWICHRFRWWSTSLKDF